MKQFVVVAVLIVVAIVVARSLDTPAENPPTETQSAETPTTVAAAETAFQDLDIAKALAKADQEGKLVMLDFTTSQCGYCRLLEKNTFSKEQVQEFLKAKVVAIKVDGNRQRSLVQKYQIRGYPTMVFVGRQGYEVGRITGYVGSARFLDEAESFRFRAKL